MQSSQPRHLQVVLKTVERCNIACRYCYFFYAGDQSFISHPVTISRETIKSVAQFLKEGVRDLQAQSLHVTLHGGEPTLQKLADFDFMCETMKSELASITSLHFSIQTNATLINEKWLKMFEKHQVNVGVSIDGLAQHHDNVRVDKRGRGTHQRVVNGINQLVKAHEAGRIPRLGALCVAHPSQEGFDIYQFFTKSLGLKGFDILLPTDTHDTFDRSTASAYGRLLNQVFDAWVLDDNPNIQIRIFSAFLAKLRGMDSYLFTSSASPESFFAFTISSDGSLFGDDSLRVVPAFRPDKSDSIFTTTLSQYARHEQFVALTSLRRRAPMQCQRCCWLSVCGGGNLENRYSEERQFDNPSVLCDGLKLFFGHATSYILANGYGRDRLLSALKLVPSDPMEGADLAASQSAII